MRHPRRAGGLGLLVTSLAVASAAAYVSGRASPRPSSSLAAVSGSPSSSPSSALGAASPSSTASTATTRGLASPGAAAAPSADAATPAASCNAAPPLTSQPPKKIGLLVEPTPFTHVSGYSNRFNEMLKYLAKAGDNVKIITPDDKEDAPTERYGFPINTIQGFRFPLYNEICLTFDIRKRATLEVMQRFQPDILHSTSPGFICFIAIFAARALKIPLVFSYHTHLPIYTKRYLRGVPGAESMAWNILRFVHNRADLTLATSPQMKEELEANGIERVEVWQKGIDTEIFHPKYRDEDTRRMLTDGHPEAPLILYVGRLGMEKCLTDIRAVLEANPEARLAFVGGGPAEAELKEYFKGTNTVFTGLLRGEALSKAFASADVFCMPSDSETLGFVVLESMASGVPVIGANAGGIPNLIQDGVTGLLTNPRDTRDLAAKVMMLLTDSERRKEMSLAARKEAETWDWESATSKLRNVQYQQAIENFRKRRLNADVEDMEMRIFEDHM